MISSLKKLILKIKNKYKINKKNILAHSDIAPFRKKDPGKNFPWQSLKIPKFLNFKKFKKNDIKIMEKWFNKIILNQKKKIIFIFIINWV